MFQLKKLCVFVSLCSIKLKSLRLCVPLVTTLPSPLVPFVLAYIVYCWRAIDIKKLDKEELKNDHAY